MPLVPMSRLLRHARAHRYAVGYFEAWHPVPPSLILNEGARVPLLGKALRAGFNVVMHDHEKSSPEESLDINRYLVRTAHAMDAEVEAELGELPAHDSKTRTESRGRKTDPEAAADFVRATGVDAL